MAKDAFNLFVATS